MRLVKVVLFVLCASMLVGCSTQDLEKLLSSSNLAGNLSASNQKDETGITLRNARICDPSGCYIAWNVVDSDGDGVSDADELMAGTNPFDPKSRPSLVVVAELGGKQQLPSFEAGLGAFTVFPAELMAMIEKTKDDPLGDLPLSAFPLTKERGDALTRLGISSELLTQYNIDAERDGFTVQIGKTTDNGVPERRIGGVEVRLISSDDEHCCYPLLPIEPDAQKMQFGENGTRTVFSDGSFVIDFDDGSGVYIDNKGNKIVSWYVNPDADQVTEVPTPEQEAAFKRLRGAVVRTLENWEAPDSGADPNNPRDLIILVDPEYAFDTAMVYDAPRVTGAQPETRDDLPNPGVAANPDDFKDSCVVGCP